MARRRIAEEPTSRLAIWARRMALFALAVTLLAIILMRLGFFEVVPGLVTFGGALVFAFVGMLLALGAFGVIWQEGYGGFGYAMMALATGLALFAYPAYLGIRSYSLPSINDISTDIADPPRFEAIARLRPREANSVTYPGARFSELQRRAYPDIETVQLSSTPQQAHDAALAVITKHKWLVVVDRSPVAGRREGHIEAVARTAIMGFRDDVVVRIRADAGGARIDIRSASRYGKLDFGANAERIRRMIEEIDEAVGTQAAAPRR